MHDKTLAAETLKVLSKNANNRNFKDRPFDGISKIHEEDIRHYLQTSTHKALDILLLKERRLIKQFNIDPTITIDFKKSNLKNLTKTLFSSALLMLPYLLDENYELKSNIKNNISEKNYAEFIKHDIDIPKKIHKALWIEYIQKYLFNYLSDKNESQKIFLSSIISSASSQLTDSWKVVIQTHYNLKPEVKAARMFSESLESCINYLEEDWKNFKDKLRNEAVSDIKKTKCDALFKALDAFLAIKDEIDNKLKNRRAFSTKDIEDSIQAFHKIINVTLPKVLHHTNPFFERANQIIDSLIKRIKYLFSKENSSFEYSNFANATSVKAVFFETSTYANIKSICREMKDVEPLIRSNLLKKR